MNKICDKNFYQAASLVQMYNLNPQRFVDNLSRENYTRDENYTRNEKIDNDSIHTYGCSVCCKDFPYTNYTSLPKMIIRSNPLPTKSGKVPETPRCPDRQKRCDGMYDNLNVGVL